MKKILVWVCVGLLGPLGLHAEQFTFVTTMSAPVASFAWVEAVEQVNAGSTALYDVDTISLRGNANATASLGALSLNGGILQTKVGVVQAKQLTVYPGGIVNGESLIAGTLNVSRAATGDIGVLNVNVVNGSHWGDGALHVSYAGTKTLNLVDNTGKTISTITPPEANFDKNMTWKNHLLTGTTTP